MLVDTAHDHRIALVSALRLGAIGLGAVVFAGLCAPLPPGFAGLPYLAGYLAIFLLGSGFRVFRAVARNETDRPTPASWSGATAATAFAAAAASLMLALLGADGVRLLAAYAVAINAAYVPAKVACLFAGCCREVRPLTGWLAGADLRRAEIGGSVTVLLAVGLALAVGRPNLAAILGIGAHLALRRLSHGHRQPRPRPFMSLKGFGLESIGLSLALAMAVLLPLMPDPTRVH